MNLEVLDWVDARWRVRVDLPPGVVVRAFTVGLLSENGAPLGPAVVGPEAPEASVVVEVRGPCPLPPGAVARIVVDVEGGAVLSLEVVLARRRGLHAWLSADGLLPVTSNAALESLTGAEKRQLARRWGWFAGAEAPQADLDPDVRDMLAEFGVDPADISDELSAQLRGR